ncbi:MAG: hypothetical protein LBB07_01385 [Bifidobacteriaceae bacterium]|jgi:hypothetical protein|nr:hypothetical protein [Bifidobacteriaceae bacterium]
MNDKHDIYDELSETDENVSIDEALVDSPEDAERLMGVMIDSDDGDFGDADDDGDPDIFEN